MRMPARITRFITLSSRSPKKALTSPGPAQRYRLELMAAGSYIKLGGASGTPPRPPARCAGVNPATVVIELGGASGAPPRPPARCAGVNPATLAGVAQAGR